MSVEKHKKQWEDQKRAERAERAETTGSEETTGKDNVTEHEFAPNISIEGKDYWIAHRGGHGYYVVDEDDNVTNVVISDGLIDTEDPSPEELAVLKARPPLLSAEQEATFLMENVASNVVKLQEQVARMGEGGFQGGDSSSNSGDSSSDGDSDGDAEMETSLTMDYAEADIHASEIKEWVQNLTSLFADLDPEGVETRPAQVEGKPGIILETAKPWETGYHSGDGWDDKAGWDKHREAFTEAMQARDEIKYYGEPDYFNFVAKEDVSGIVG